MDRRRERKSEQSRPEREAEVEWSGSGDVLHDGADSGWWSEPGSLMDNV